MDRIRPIDPRDRNPEQFLRVERLREERDATERRERREAPPEHHDEAPAQPAPDTSLGDVPHDPDDDSGDGSLIDVRV